MTTTVLNLRTQKCLELGLEGKKQIIQCNKEVELESGVWIRETWENKKICSTLYTDSLNYKLLTASICTVRGESVPKCRGELTKQI